MLRIGIIYFFYFLAHGAALPYFQVFLRQEKGVGLFEVGALQMLLPLAALLAGPGVGRYADRCTRPGALMATLMAGAFLFLVVLYLFDSFTACIVGLFGFGVCFHVFLPLVDSQALDQATGKRRDYGKLRTTGSVGFLLANFLLPWVLHQGSGDLSSWFLWLLWIGMSMGSVAILCLGIPRANPRHRDKATKSSRATRNEALRLLMRPSFRPLVFAALLGAAAMGAYYGYFSIYLNEVLGVDEKNIGPIWAVGPICEIGFLLFAVPLIERFGLRRVLALSLLAVVLRMGTLALAPNILIVVATQALHALTFGGIHTCGILLARRAAPEGQNNALQSTYAALNQGGAYISGYLLGAVCAETFGVLSVFWAASGLGMVGLVVLFTKVAGEAPEPQVRDARMTK